MNTTMIFVADFLVSCAMSYILWRLPVRYFLDKAGDRSLHVGVIPRSGGIAILMAFASAYAITELSFFTPLMLGALSLLCLISLWDDIAPLSQVWRLMVHLLACAVMVFVEQLYVVVWDAMPLLLSQIITLLGLVWMINLYNFMDGMDGFASGMGMLGFGAFALLGYLQGDLDYFVMNSCLVAAVFGFWIWNFPPARIFMGDTGSIFLGAMAGIMALHGVQREIFPLWVPVIVFSPFWVDATFTLFRRIYRREKYWKPHRSHLYQRLVSSGLGHRTVVLCQYALMLACSISVCLPLLFGLDYNASTLVLWGGLYPALILLIEFRLKK